MFISLPAALFWFSILVLFYTTLGYPLLLWILSRLARRPRLQRCGQVAQHCGQAGAFPVRQPFLADLPIGSGSRLRYEATAGQENARPTSPPPDCAPTVSVILVAHNEESRIRPRLENILASDYPPDRLEIVLVSDGSTDNTVEQARRLNEPRISIVEDARQRGKAHGLNRGLAAAQGEILVLADTRQEFAPATVRSLIAGFADPAVGAVSGSLEIALSRQAVGAGVGFYWRLEKILRRLESDVDSCIGCTGAVYAARRALVRPIPPDTILDDVVIPMAIAIAGYRVIFNAAAKAFDPMAQDAAREWRRKSRTLAGNFQLLFRYPAWLNPFRNRLWWQTISHKYLRLAGPFLLLLALASNGALLADPFYFVLFLLQCALYAAGLAGLLAPHLGFQGSGFRIQSFLRRLGFQVSPACSAMRSASRSIAGRGFRFHPFFLLSIPAGFLFLNAMVLSGLWQYVRRRHRSGWQ